MIQLANAPTQKPKELDQQKTNFTSEGAPPPEPTPPGSPAKAEHDKRSSAGPAHASHPHVGNTARG